MTVLAGAVPAAAAGATTGTALPALAGLCAGVAGWLAVAGPPRRRVRLLLPPAPGPAPGRAARRRPLRAAGPPLRRLTRRWSVPDSVVAAGCLLLGGVPALAGRSPLPLLTGLLVTVPAVRVRRRRAARRRAERRAEAVIALCGALAGEVLAGRPPERALLAAGVPGLGEEAAAGILAAARYGGNVPEALRAAAGLPGADGLRGVAACWQVAVDSGASLAAGLERVAEALRAERDQREDLRTQLAGPRATVLVLALLPAAGLLLGAGMGVAPLQVLLHTPEGLAALVAGGLLEWAGLAWSAAIVRRAEGAAR
ncbi:tight adherence protein B [Streptomyces aidingensis]|uniref:Tight adherence protein B n=2 Tax=Streptomyces aidingensis TaxID=910347 RepID=A0A1I1KID1_9ACTN|nr:tight adherence protein B [Streptomyces aidingensis]